MRQLRAQMPDRTNGGWLRLRLRFRGVLGDLLSNLGEFNFKVPGVGASGSRQQVEPAAALGAAVAARAEGCWAIAAAYGCTALSGSPRTVPYQHRLSGLDASRAPTSASGCAIRLMLTKLV